MESLSWRDQYNGHLRLIELVMYSWFPSKLTMGAVGAVRYPIKPLELKTEIKHKLTLSIRNLNYAVVRIDES